MATGRFHHFCAHHHVGWSRFIVALHQVHDQMYVDAEAHNMAQAAYAQKRHLGSTKTWWDGGNDGPVLPGPPWVSRNGVIISLNS